MASISVITVCLNAVKGIKRTATSLLGQTDKDFEWIVVDGQSTDGTVEYLRQLPHLTHLVSEKDSGIYEAMNKGIGLAKNDYCLFLNAGDSLFDGSVIERVRPYLTANIAIGRIMICYPEKPAQNQERDFELQDIRAKYLYKRSLPHQSTFIERNLFIRYGLYDTSYKIAGDHDFFARVLLHGVSKVFVPFCISEYMMDGISTTLKRSNVFKNEIIRIRKKNFSRFYRLRRLVIDSIDRGN